MWLTQIEFVMWLSYNSYVSVNIMTQIFNENSTVVPLCFDHCGANKKCPVKATY